MFPPKGAPIPIERSLATLLMLGKCNVSSEAVVQEIYSKKCVEVEYGQKLIRVEFSDQALEALSQQRMPASLRLYVLPSSRIATGHVIATVVSSYNQALLDAIANAIIGLGGKCIDLHLASGNYINIGCKGRSESVPFWR